MKQENNSGASFPPLYSGPSWNVPRVSLPGLFGMQPQYGTEWWYYVGTIFDTDGEPFSLQLEILRVDIGPFQIGYGITGIGLRSQEESFYISGQGIGLGVNDTNSTLPSALIPPVTDHAWSASLVPWLELVNRSPDLLKDFHVNLPGLNGWGGWQFEYLAEESSGNPVGAVGSRYSLKAMGRGYQTSSSSSQMLEAQYQVSLTMEDKRGTVMEGISGYVVLRCS